VLPSQLDSKALQRLLSNAPDPAPPLRLVVHDSARGWGEAPSALECPSAGLADLLKEYVAQDRHLRLADFDSHLDDLQRDWLNPGLLD
jgi:ER membrane protein complex subunit 8/9